MREYRFNNVVLTKESLNAALQYYIDLCAEIIAENPDNLRIYEWQTAEAADLNQQLISGEIEISFALLQRAHSMQTGECIALLP